MTYKGKLPCVTTAPPQQSQEVCYTYCMTFQHSKRDQRDVHVSKLDVHYQNAKRDPLCKDWQ